MAGRTPQLRLGIDASWLPFPNSRDEQAATAASAPPRRRADRKRLKVRMRPVGATQLERSTGRRQIRPAGPAARHHVHARAPARPGLHPPYLDFLIVILARRDGPNRRA